MRNASVEVEVREEVAKEMQQAIVRMQDDFSKRLQEQVSRIGHRYLWLGSDDSGHGERAQDGPQDRHRIPHGHAGCFTHMASTDRHASFHSRHLDDPRHRVDDRG